LSVALSSSLGTVRSGTWNGSNISTTYTDAKVTSVNGQVGAATGFATTANSLAQFAATTSAQLLGVISDETGSGSLVFATNPTLVTPVLGLATGTSVMLSANIGAAAGNISGNFSVTGNVDATNVSAGNITTTGRYTGSGAGLTSIPNNSIVGLTTANVAELTNLYYTNARVRATIFANSGVYYNSTTGTFGIGQNVDTTSNVTFNDVNVNGRLYSDDITAANVTVQGNLTVTGTVTTVNTEEINLADNKILLNSNFAGTPTENGGFIINRGNLANTEFIWNEFNDRWEFTNNGTVYYPVATSTTDLQEGANLYYTNARARLAISANSNILYNSTTGTISLDSNVLTTANVVESSSRLYYTNARVITAVQQTTLSNVTVSGNVAAGNINITGRITGDGAGLSNVSVGALIGFTTQNVTEVVNLYFTNARARAAISAGSGLVYNESTGVIRVDPNSQGGGGGGADFAASLIYSQP
jgi:hypothetical protein